MAMCVRNFPRAGLIAVLSPFSKVSWFFQSKIVNLNLSCGKDFQYGFFLYFILWLRSLPIMMIPIFTLDSLIAQHSILASHPNRTCGNDYWVTHCVLTILWWCKSGDKNIYPLFMGFSWGNCHFQSSDEGGTIISRFLKKTNLKVMTKLLHLILMTRTFLYDLYIDFL